MFQSFKTLGGWQEIKQTPGPGDYINQKENKTKYRTEYRNRFNQEKPLHKNALRVNIGRLPRKLIDIYL